MKFRDIMNGGDWIEIPQTRQAEFRVSVYAIIEQENQLLFIKDGRSKQGLEFPGGGIELGQTPQEALEREVREETGYSILSQSIYICNVTNENYYHASKDRYFCGISLYFLCELVSNIAQEQQLDSFDEIDEVLWLDKGSLKVDDIATYHQCAYTQYLQGLERDNDK